MQVSVVNGALDSVKTDVLVAPVFEDGFDADPFLSDLDARLDGALTAALSSADVSSKLHRASSVLSLGKLPVRRVLLVGAGKQAEWDAKRARTTAGTAIRHLKSSGQAAATLYVPPAGDLVASAAAAVHGAVLADFSVAQYKTRGEDETEFQHLQLLVAGAPQDLTTVTQKSRVIGDAANLARSLANEPGNKLTPTIFAQRAQEVADAHGLGCEILDEAELERRGYGAILGTSRGSDEPARMVTLRYRAEDESAPTLGLVGKGITFDSGGISINPAERMHLMKTDMSGAAAVLGAMQAIAQLRPSVNVVAVLCLAENLPGPTAMKPGDILTAGNGETIEIINTDAEGRLVLADGLVHAKSEGATHLVDIATLTGACVVALGTTNTGVFGSSQPWTDALLEAARHTGEAMWQMPVGAEYRERMNSDIADIANAGGREGGACTAAAFLQDFAGDSPWIHLDIAGTARNDRDLPYVSKGPTGVAVATLTQLAQTVGERGVPVEQ